MKITCAIYLLVALFCVAHAEFNYKEELQAVYDYGKTQFTPVGYRMLSVTSTVGHSAIEDPELFVGQDKAEVQVFVDKTTKILKDIDEAMQHKDSEDFVNKAIVAFKAIQTFKWKEGLSEKTVKHIEDIKEKYDKQYQTEIVNVLQGGVREMYDKFTPRFDAFVDKLTTEEKQTYYKAVEFHELMKKSSLSKFTFFWRFLDWAESELKN